MSSNQQKSTQQKTRTQAPGQLRIPKRKKPKNGLSLPTRRSTRIIQRNQRELNLSAPQAPSPSAEQQNQILSNLQGQESDPQTTTQTTSQTENQHSHDEIESDDDVIINNAHNINNPSQSDLLENSHIQTDLLNLHGNDNDNGNDNDILMNNNQQINQQQLLNLLQESQSFQNARHVSFNPTQQHAPAFSFHQTQLQSDNNFLEDFNTTDLLHGDSQSNTPAPQHQLHPQSKDSLIIKCLEKIVQQLERKKQAPAIYKQIYDILGQDIQKFELSQAHLKGYIQQRLELASNRAYKESKNLAPSQKKVHSLTTVSDIISVIQTMLAVKDNYLSSLITKLQSQNKLLNNKLILNTITFDEIVNYLNDSSLLLKILFDEKKDVNITLGKVSDIFSFTRIKDVNYVFPAAYHSLIKSQGRLKISSALDTAGVYDCISKSEVSNRLKSQLNKNKYPPKKSNYLPKCRFIPNCTNFNKNHRSTFYHPKSQSQIEKPNQSATNAPSVPVAPQPAQQ